MLTVFDWIRRSQNGSELIATIDGIKSSPELFRHEETIGQPVLGRDGPCQRCWIFPRLSASPHCKTCHAIINAARGLGSASQNSLVLWGHLNFLPETLKADSRLDGIPEVRVYLKDENHFLCVLKSYDLKEWLRKLVSSQSEIKGSLTIFPTTRKKPTFSMGDILCLAIQHDSRFPMDRLRIRYFSSPGQLKNPYKREKKGLLNFEGLEFLNFLDMAAHFKTLLSPIEQKVVKEVVGIKNEPERRFHWGRLMRELELETRDVLSEWGFKSLKGNELKLLDELTKYVNFTH